LLAIVLLGQLLVQLASIVPSIAQAPQPAAPAGAAKAGDAVASALPQEIASALS